LKNSKKQTTIKTYASRISFALCNNMKYFWILAFTFLSFSGFSQLGGKQVYTFLKLPTSARAAALGGNQIAVSDDDLNLVADNPALLTQALHNNATLTYINYISDINMGYLAYARHYDGIGTFSLGMQSIGYGDFTRTDETGQEIGSFKAGEYAFDVSYSNKLTQTVRYGGTMKMIYSSFAERNSFGLALDLGVQYTSRSELFSAGMVVNNLGAQLKPYVSGERAPVATEVQLAMAYRLPKAPIRFNLLLHNMQQWDITNDNISEGVPTITPDGSQRISSGDESFFTFEKLMHHVTIGAEILPSDNFHLRIGYNYYRKQTLGQTGQGALNGISFGLGFRIKRFQLSYGLASYHIGAASHHLGVTTNLSDFKR